MKPYVLVLILFFCPVLAHASLTEKDLDRVKAFKKIIREVDAKSMQQTVRELEKSHNPRLQLAMKEAMAKTYADIVREQDVQALKDKEWLYSMIALNMAYLQFGGSGNQDALNRLICRKLKEYLPADTVNHPDFHNSVD